MDEWANDDNKSDGSTVTMPSLVGESPRYLKNTPRCPAGGSYGQVFTVGVDIRCNYTPPAWFDVRGDKYRHRPEGS